MSTTRLLLDGRREFSLQKIRHLCDTVAAALSQYAHLDFTIFSAGSYGRLEASEFSDLDLFFIHGDETNQELILEVINQVKSIALELGHLPLTETYLKPYSATAATAKLGSPEDDYENHFTVRMLLLLESKYIFNENFYKSHIENIIAAYFRDYHSHSGNFRPVFLVNDIVRYWKTLCLNYENKRNELQVDQKVKAKVRNFKLKFSRMTTCYATIAALSCLDNPSPDDVLALVRKTPIQRLASIKESISETECIIDTLIEHYCWFLSKTELSTPAIEALFLEADSKREHFNRAAEYGNAFYGLLHMVDGALKNSLLRFTSI